MKKTLSRILAVAMSVSMLAASLKMRTAGLF